MVQVKDEKGQRAFDHGATTDRVEKGMAEDKKLGDAPGFLPVGLIRFVLPVAVTMQKGDMIEALPTVEQFLIPVPMDEEVNRQFQSLSTSLLRRSSRTGMCRTWPDACSGRWPNCPRSWTGPRR